MWGWGYVGEDSAREERLRRLPPRERICHVHQNTTFQPNTCPSIDACPSISAKRLSIYRENSYVSSTNTPRFSPSSRLDERLLRRISIAPANRWAETGCSRARRLTQSVCLCILLTVRVKRVCEASHRDNVSVTSTNTPRFSQAPHENATFQPEACPSIVLIDTFCESTGQRRLPPRERICHVHQNTTFQPSACPSIVAYPSI